MKVLSIGISDIGGGIQKVFKISNSIKNEKIILFTAYDKKISNKVPDFDLNSMSSEKNVFKRIFYYFHIGNNYKKIKKVLLEEKVDIIHIHGYVGLGLTFWRCIRKYKGNAKVVLSAHGYGLICANYSCYDYNSRRECQDCIMYAEKMAILNSCDKRGRIYSIIRYIDFKLRKIVMQKYNMLDGIITPSDYLKNVLNNSTYKFPDISVINNPVEINNNLYRFKNKKNTIVFLGRFSEEKNVIMLIEAFMILQKKYKDINLKILGEGKLRKNYIKYIRKNNVKNIYISSHFLDNKEIDKELEDAKILVLPTSSPETFGLVILEGLLKGLIPVALNLGGQSELIKKLEMGILYNENTSESLAIAIDKGLSEYEDMEEKYLGDSIKIIETEFSETYYKNKLTNYYKELVKEK